MMDYCVFKRQLQNYILSFNSIIVIAPAYYSLSFDELKVQKNGLYLK